MNTRSRSNNNNNSFTIPTNRNRRKQKPRNVPELRESIPTMADQRTMKELLQCPNEGYGDAIVLPQIDSENFELKIGLIQLVSAKQFYGFEKDDLHQHIRWFNKLTSTIKMKDVPQYAVKLMLFPFSLEGAARIWLEKEPPQLHLYMGRPCSQIC